jgi:hypothetical protein
VIPQLLRQRHVAHHEAGLRREVAHELLLRRGDRVTRLLLDGEPAEELPLVPHRLEDRR